MSTGAHDNIFAHEANPFIDPPNPFEGYNQSIEKLKNKPEGIQFDKMCYELFEHNELGRKFMEYILITKILRPTCEKNNPMIQILAVWSEGFKDFYLMISNAVTSHKQRISAENDKKVEVKHNDG